MKKKTEPKNFTPFGNLMDSINSREQKGDALSYCLMAAEFFVYILFGFVPLFYSSPVRGWFFALVFLASAYATSIEGFYIAALFGAVALVLSGVCWQFTKTESGATAEAIFSVALLLGIIGLAANIGQIYISISTRLDFITLQVASGNFVNSIASIAELLVWIIGGAVSFATSRIPKK